MLNEVPGYVQNAPYVRNGVEVRGGSNWDLSRSAVETPIARAVDPQPMRPAGVPDAVLAETPYRVEHHMPGFAPTVVVHFARNSATLNYQGQRDLKHIARNTAVVVAGHADANERHPRELARQRADKVTSHLRKLGYHVTVTKYFSSDLPLTESPFKVDRNQRVEVFAR